MFTQFFDAQNKQVPPGLEKQLRSHRNSSQNQKMLKSPIANGKSRFVNFLQSKTPQHNQNYKLPRVRISATPENIKNNNNNSKVKGNDTTIGTPQIHQNKHSSNSPNMTPVNLKKANNKAFLNLMNNFGQNEKEKGKSGQAQQLANIYFQDKENQQNLGNIQSTKQKENQNNGKSIKQKQNCPKKTFFQNFDSEKSDQFDITAFNTMDSQVYYIFMLIGKKLTNNSKLPSPRTEANKSPIISKQNQRKLKNVPRFFNRDITIKEFKETLSKSKANNNKALSKSSMRQELSYDEQLLQQAEQNNLSQCAKLLNKWQVNVNYRSAVDNRSALHWACMNNNMQLVQILIQKEANPNLQDLNNQTALMYSSKSGSLEICKHLLEHPSCNVNLSDNEGNTALHLGSLHGHSAVVELLLKQPGINIFVKNKARKSPLEVTFYANIVKCFQEHFVTLQNGQNNENWQDVLKIHGVLGKGSFGIVYLVSHRQFPGRFFALKALSKSYIFSHNLSKYTLIENNILQNSRSHPFIIQLYQSFQTQSHLFLLLQYCPCGDLSEKLQSMRRFPEAVAKFYLCELVLAIEELHRQAVVYRDLKPENVVIEETGHIRLTDFGLAKQGVTQGIEGAESFCGSVAYLAPEMLKRHGHGRAVDWYLLGVAFYEMLAGIPPYYANEREQLFQNIQSAPLRMPSSISDEAKNLLKALLLRNPMKRLGSGNTDAVEIKSHPYFANVNWNDVYEKKLTPPTPDLKIKMQKPASLNVFGTPASSKDKNYIEGWTFLSPDFKALQKQ